MITFPCECGKRYQVKDELAGKRAKCSCGKTLVIPSATAGTKKSQPATAAQLNSSPPPAYKNIQDPEAIDSQASQHGQHDVQVHSIDRTAEASKQIVGDSIATSVHADDLAPNSFAQLIEFRTGEVAIDCNVRKGTFNELYHWYAVCPDSVDSLTRLLQHFRISKESVLRIYDPMGHKA